MKTLYWPSNGCAHTSLDRHSVEPRCADCGVPAPCCDPEDPPRGHCPSCHEDRYAHALTCALPPSDNHYPAHTLGDWSRP
jgi:hypothetical protein